ncbi:MAG TPA: MFS transporter [Planococcus sp. (in: firmicutes)]|nr:MFS transporter [Planococcus sp. (in: firmicutes)]
MRFLIYLIIFFAFFDLFAQLPIMSPYAISLGATPFLTGLVIGMYSLSNTFGNILSGIFTDRKGPFLVLVLGLLGSGAMLFTYSLADSPASLLLIRFLHGLASGLIVPAAFTYLANRTEKSKRGKGSAISGAFVGMAAILGPAFGAIYASRTSTPDTMMVIGTFLLALGLLAIFILRKTIIQKGSRIDSRLPFQQLLRNRGLMQAFSGAFFLMFSQGVLAYMLPLKVSGLGYAAEMSGLLLSTFGVAAILVFLLPVNRIFDVAKPQYTLIAGLVIMASSLFVLSAAAPAWLLYFTMSTYGIGFAFLFPSINSLLVDSTRPSSRGRAYGYFYAFFSLGVVAGSSITGALGVDAAGGFMLSGSVLLTLAFVNSLLLRAGKAKTSALD